MALWVLMAVDYQRIPTALADRPRLGLWPMTCQEMTASLGMGVVSALVEVLRSKAKPPGCVRLAGGGHEQGH
ncbi:hypothetical protein [Streptomyces sp. NPDC004250]|uniref:hypothetical protein n=1 Tax=Streptomyces sp. NPDC004250 TaxID=3364692 RepID=UPI00368BAEDB